MKYVKNNPALAGPMMMFIFAALFGYFGFYIGFLHTNNLGQFVLFYALLDWTLKATAVAFALAGVLTMIQPFLGNLLYAVTGLLNAILFVVIATMDILDKQNPPGAVPIFLLLIFAAFNGYGSVASLTSLWQIKNMSVGPPMDPPYSQDPTNPPFTPREPPH